MNSSPLISGGLLLLANVAFGYFLHDLKVSEVTWILACSYLVFECAVISVAWKPVRNFILLGFKSDVGYALMALIGASLAVVLFVWIRITSYFLMMLAAALLLRVDLFTRRIRPWLTFLVLVGLSFVGLAMSWIPRLTLVR